MAKKFFKKFFPQILLFFLAALFFLSAPKKEKTFKTALLNPKHSVQKIVLGDQSFGKISLEKAGSFWLGKKEFSDGKTVFFPCDSDAIKGLLSALKKISTVVEVSGSKSLSSYGLEKGGAFFLGLYGEGGEKEAVSIYFGSLDSRRRIFFFVPKRQKIFAMDSQPLAPYLSLDMNFWVSPEIFPKDIVGADKKWRRGKMALSPKGQALLAQDFDWSGAKEKIFDAGDGNVFKALFLPAEEGDYYCLFLALPSAQRPQVEKEALKKINSISLVSSWTFERLLLEE